MDEMRNIIRQSFGMDSIDEDDDISVKSDAGRYRANMGHVFESLIFPLCAAYYIYNGSINFSTESIKNIILNKLSVNKDTKYDINSLFDKKVSSEPESEIVANKRKLEADLSDHLYVEMRNYFPTTDPLQLDKKIQHVEFKSDNKPYYALVIGVRLPQWQKYEHMVNNAKNKTKKDSRELRSKDEQIIKEYLSSVSEKNPQLSETKYREGLFYVYKIFMTPEELIKFQSTLRIPKFEIDVEKRLLNELATKGQALTDIIEFNFTKKDGKPTTVLPVAQDILKNKDRESEKYEIIESYIETTRSQISSISEIKAAKTAFESVKKKPHKLYIKVSGIEGQSGDTKGEVKGDIIVSIKDSVKEIFNSPISLKAGNKTVASLLTRRVFVHHTLRAIEPIRIPAKKYKENIEEYKNDTRSTDKMPYITRYFVDLCINELEAETPETSSERRSRLLFSLINTLAHGSDDASIVSLVQDQHQLRTITPAITEFIKAMNAKTVCNSYGKSNAGIKFEIQSIIEDGDSYGILLMSYAGVVQIDDKLDGLLIKLQKVFGENSNKIRHLLWDINRINVYIDKLIDSLPQMEQSKALDVLSFHFTKANANLDSIDEKKIDVNVVRYAERIADYDEAMRKCNVKNLALDREEINKAGEIRMASYVTGRLNLIIQKIANAKKSLLAK